MARPTDPERLPTTPTPALPLCCAGGALAWALLCLGLSVCASDARLKGSPDDPRAFEVRLRDRAGSGPPVAAFRPYALAVLFEGRGQEAGQHLGAWLLQALPARPDGLVSSPQFERLTAAADALTVLHLLQETTLPGRLASERTGQGASGADGGYGGGVGGGAGGGAGGRLDRNGDGLPGVHGKPGQPGVGGIRGAGGAKGWDGGRSSGTPSASRSRRVQPSTTEAFGWLLGSSERLDLFLGTLRPEDNIVAASHVVQELMAHAPEALDRWYNLVLALALVCDSAPHAGVQPGDRDVPGTPAEAAELFDYFRDLYASRDAGIAYDELSPAELAMVVGPALPLTELQWARENVRGSSGKWGRTFFAVPYDNGSLRAGCVWQHGPYTLERIRRYGGVCVDQAYYAACTARAVGIPAVLFRGQGIRGQHAWIGYMKRPGEWGDAGRYVYDRYMSGTAIDPQTGLECTDHDLELGCAVAQRSERRAAARKCYRLALVLRDLGRTEAALCLAAEATAREPLLCPAWALQADLLEQARRPADRLALLEREAGALRCFPDAAAAVQKRRADALVALGRGDEATALLRRLENRMGHERDDLARYAGFEQVGQMRRAGDMAGARRKLEEILGDNRDEGMKVVQIVEEYLALTRETDQTKEAARFLDGYLTSMTRRYADELMPMDKGAFLKLLRQAYENAHDSDGVRRLDKRIEAAGEH